MCVCLWLLVVGVMVRAFWACVGVVLRKHQCQLASTCKLAKKANKSFTTNPNKRKKQKAVGKCDEWEGGQKL